ncbi:MAG: hypothetical protein AAF990_01730 [Bacteroidota bacterium]
MKNHLLFGLLIIMSLTACQKDFALLPKSKDKAGLLVKEIKYFHKLDDGTEPSKTDSTLYFYNDQKLLIRKENYDLGAIQTIVRVEVYTYDGRKRLIKEQTENLNGSVFRHTEYTYKGNSKRISTETKFNQAEENPHTHYEYEYNDKGQMIKMDRYNMGYSQLDNNATKMGLPFASTTEYYYKNNGSLRMSVFRPVYSTNFIKSVYIYNEANMLTEEYRDEILMNSYTYEADGLVKKFNGLGTLVEEVQYDKVGQIVSSKRFLSRSNSTRVYLTDYTYK